MPEKEPIGVIGVGWVGLVTTACFADLGHEIFCRDIDAAKIGLLERGEVPIHEAGLNELLERHSDRIHYSTEMGDVLTNTKLLFVCVDTPPTYSGDADLSRVDAVVSELEAERGHALVMKSTVPVGTGRAVERRLAEAGKQVAYVSNPEFLKEGSAIGDFMNPDRVVVGADPGSEDGAADAVAALYEPLGQPIVRTDVASAEMIKLASNAFLATKISFINEIANVCEEVGADVQEVSDGMGLDQRIGPKFLSPGIGYGGSCLAGDETVLVRYQSETRLVGLQELYERLESDGLSSLGSEGSLDLLHPEGLEVLSWDRGREVTRFESVSAVTRRQFEGEIVDLRSKMGRRLTCTPDHPMVVADKDSRQMRSVRPAEDLTENDWLPLAQSVEVNKRKDQAQCDLLAGLETVGLSEEDVIVRPRKEEIEAAASMSVEERNTVLTHDRGSRIRLYDVVRSGAVRLDELGRLGLQLEGAAVGTARNGTYVPVSITADESFWRVVGLYLAEGHCTVDGERGERYRMQWSFHPSKEMDLVDEVAGYWRGLGVKASIYRRSTTTAVSVSSRILAGWWLGALGLGRDCYTQRLPNLIWEQSDSCKRAVLEGLWLGDGSWSYVAHGPSVVLEWGSVSRELADGVLRLLGELGIVARLKVGRTSKSTCDTYWIVVSGADQIEQALFLVKPRDRHLIQSSINGQKKRIKPTGYRRTGDGVAWVRVDKVERRPFKGKVYSLDVPSTSTFVTTTGLVIHNCFPKDVSALKQLAGNSGYHFQLLNSVIEVNELQKRRVVRKLKKHLGTLVGKRIALLGLAFKPHTDDMREASSLVLAARLQGEGAHVFAYDPVAENRAEELLAGAHICDSAFSALDKADAAVIVTEWPEFGELPLKKIKEKMANPLIIDGRNMLDRDAVRDAGIVYEGIGR